MEKIKSEDIDKALINLLETSGHEVFGSYSVFKYKKGYYASGLSSGTLEDAGDCDEDECFDCGTNETEEKLKNYEIEIIEKLCSDRSHSRIDQTITAHPTCFKKFFRKIESKK